MTIKIKNAAVEKNLQKKNDTETNKFALQEEKRFVHLKKTNAMMNVMKTKNAITIKNSDT